MNKIKKIAVMTSLMIGFTMGSLYGNTNDVANASGPAPSTFEDSTKEPDAPQESPLNIGYICSCKHDSNYDYDGEFVSSDGNEHCFVVCSEECIFARIAREKCQANIINSNNSFNGDISIGNIEITSNCNFDFNYGQNHNSQNNEASYIVIVGDYNNIKDSLLGNHNSGVEWHKATASEKTQFKEVVSNPNSSNSTIINNNNTNNVVINNENTSEEPNYVPNEPNTPEEPIKPSIPEEPDDFEPEPFNPPKVSWEYDEDTQCLTFSVYLRSEDDIFELRFMNGEEEVGGFQLSSATAVNALGKTFTATVHDPNDFYIICTNQAGESASYYWKDGNFQ